VRANSVTDTCGGRHVVAIVNAMSNRLRIQQRGDTFHVNIKAVTNLRAFPDHFHRERFMELLRAEVQKSDWRCLGYTVLGTHFHVLIELKETTLSSGFQRLNSSYARWFNKRHGRTGALWQARFFAVLVESEFQFMEAQQYLALNAVRAGLVQEPEDWQYCHYGALVGRYPSDPLVDEEAILRLMGRDRRQARLRLQAYVEESDRRARRQMLLRAQSDRAQTPRKARVKRAT
jgi:putative transposase